MTEEQPRDLAGAQFAARQHLMTVKAQAAIIASQAGEITALTEANKLLAAQVAGPVVASVGDDKQLRSLIGAWVDARDYYCDDEHQIVLDCYATIVAHIDSHAAKVSARAADAPSEPNELTDDQIRDIRAKVLGQCINHNGARPADYEQKFARAIESAVKSRAADALDSQPTEDRSHWFKQWGGNPPAAIAPKAGVVPDAAQLGSYALFWAQKMGWSPTSEESVWDFITGRCAALGIASSQPTEWLPTADAINALPEGVRKYVHSLVANSDPAGTVAHNTLLSDNCENLQVAYRKMADALEEVRACFSAAEAEGLSTVLAETNDEGLKDLVERRLMHALYVAETFSSQPTDGEVRNG